MFSIPIPTMLPRSTSAMPAILLIPSVTLFIAWVWARMTRPGMPEGLDVNLSGAGGGGGGGGRVDGMARMDRELFLLSVILVLC